MEDFRPLTIHSEGQDSLEGYWVRARVWHFLPALIPALMEQLREDNRRWGDEWLQLPRLGQEDRIMGRILEYYEEYKAEGKPIPWLKIIGNAFIGWIRQCYPNIWYETR
jgi:hypothetical protein